MGLAALTPGVVPQGATSGNPLNNQSSIGNYTNPAGWNNFQIGGGVAGDNLVYVDGGPLNLPTNNWMGYIPGQTPFRSFAWRPTTSVPSGADIMAASYFSPLNQEQTISTVLPMSTFAILCSTLTASLTIEPMLSGLPSRRTSPE